MLKDTTAASRTIAARLQRIDATGHPWIDLPGRTRPVRARVLESLSRQALERALAGHKAILVLDGADDEAPIITGIVGEQIADTEPAIVETLDLAATKRLTLRCGKATITLTEAGKILIRGAYVSQRSSGVLVIDGASVRIA